MRNNEANCGKPLMDALDGETVSSLREKGKGKALVSALVAASLTGTLAVPSVVDVRRAWADGSTEASSAETQAHASGAQTSSVASAKSETVYVKTDAAGATQGIYVVNMFDTGTAQDVRDPANYTSILNLSTSDALAQRNGTVEVRTLEGEPFYYQGNLDASTHLPWDISVSYFLDGAEVSADEAAGAEGVVRVVLDVQANTEASGGVSDFANSYVLQAQGTFPEDAFRIESSSNVTVARAGSNTVASCMVLPGESKTFVLEGQARGFAYDGWQVSAMPLSLAIDLTDEETSGLTDKASELEDGTAALADGSGELSAGLVSLEDGASRMDAGARSLASGTALLQEKTENAAAGLAAIAARSTTLREAWGELYNGLSSLSDAMNVGSEEVPSLSVASAAYAAGLAQNRDEYAQAAQQAAQVQEAYKKALAAVQVAPSAENYAALNQAVQSLAAASQAAGAYGALDAAVAQYAAVDKGVQEAVVGAAALASDEKAGAFAAGLVGYTEAVDGAVSQLPALKDGIDQAALGASQLASGGGDLSAGTASAVSGAHTLANGAQSLAEAVDGIGDEILDELQKTIDEKLGGSFEAHSFVVSSNTNVSAVQFVYVIDGVSEPDTEGDSGTGATEGSSSSDSAPSTIWGRLLALFS